MEVRLMTDKELIRASAFLEYMRVPIDGEFIELTDGGNGCVLNPNTEWKEFLGHSVNGVAEAVARKLDKPVKWMRD
jgi:hypothetical protein